MYVIRPRMTTSTHELGEVCSQAGHVQAPLIQSTLPPNSGGVCIQAYYVPLSLHPYSDVCLHVSAGWNSVSKQAYFHNWCFIEHCRLLRLLPMSGTTVEASYQEVAHVLKDMQRHTVRQMDVCAGMLLQIQTCTHAGYTQRTYACACTRPRTVT